jgi:ABC-type branched-subunit amino acid transport system ATPase component
MAALLELEQVSLGFGGLRALHELDLHVDEHEIVSVIGPNGAGKSTVFNVVTGIYHPAGDIRFDGTRLIGKTPARHHAARAGPHLPEPAAVPQHDRAGERDRRDLRVDACDAARVDASPTARPS